MNYINKINSKIKSIYNAKIVYPFTKASNSKKFIFIHIPKAAGTSVRQALGEPKTGRQHLPWWVYKRGNPKKYDEFFKFSFVRDPVDRLFSGYNYLRAGGNNQSEDLAVSEYLRKYRDFNEFVEKEILLGFMMNHPVFMPQYWYLCDCYGNIMVDFIGRYETLSKDFEVVANTLAVSSKLPHANKAKATKLLVEPDSYSKSIIKELYILKTISS